MQRLSPTFPVIALASLVWMPSAVCAAPRDLLAVYETVARQATPSFAGFSAARGARFFQEPHGGEWNCATCHTPNPVTAGKHARTGKAITPLAPNANPERFADAASAEKWFRRNCNDVLGRECTPLEKGDVLTWLLSLK